MHSRLPALDWQATAGRRPPCPACSCPSCCFHQNRHHFTTIQGPLPERQAGNALLPCPPSSCRYVANVSVGAAIAACLLALAVCFAYNLRSTRVARRQW